MADVVAMKLCDTGVDVATRDDEIAVETMLISAMVYTRGSAALKTRSVLLQHVVLIVWPPSKVPVGQHQEFAWRQ